MKDDTREKRAIEISEMIQGVPPKNILISFGNEPARPLVNVLQEQQAKRSQKKKRDEYVR